MSKPTEKADKPLVILAKRTQAAASQCADKALENMKAARCRTVTLCKNPQFQTITLTTASGTVTLGAVGGAFGTAAGLVVGSAVGVVPALFTFGLSIPVGGAIGGGVGLCGGTVAGAGTGAIGGCATGFGAYKYRIEIKNGVVFIKKKTLNSIDCAKRNTQLALSNGKAKIVMLKDRSVEKVGAAATYTATKTGVVLKFTRTKAGESVVAAKNVVTSSKFQVTAATATAGSVVGGVTGGGVGGAIGAAVGVVPAIFTFGLSIPIGAAIGGGVGLCTGAVAGGSVGGAVGFGGCTYRKEIGEKGSAIWGASCNSLDFVKTTAKNKAIEAKNKAMDVKDKISSGWTGGTA